MTGRTASLNLGAASDLATAVRFPWHGGRLILVCALLGAVVGFAASTMLAPTYAGHTTVLVSSPPSSAEMGEEDIAATQAAAATLSELATAAPLLERVIRATGVGSDVDTLKSAVSTRIEDGTSLIKITVTLGSSAEAAAIANAIASELALYPSPEHSEGSTGWLVHVTVIDPAVLPTSPEGPGRGLTAALAAGLAALAAMSVSFLAKSFDADLARPGVAGRRALHATALANRIRQVVGVDETTSILRLLAIVGATAILVVAAVWLRGPLTAVALAAVVFLVLVSFRWPLLPLFSFVFLIPIEEITVVGGVGTISRYSGILFILAYGLPRLGRLRISTVPLPAWAFLGWAALSVVWALDPDEALTAFTVLVLLFMVSAMVAIAVSERPGIVRPLLWTFSLSAALTGSVGLFVFLAGSSSGGNRVSALPGQDPAHFAALLLPAFAFGLHQLLSRRATLVSAAVAIVCLAGIVTSGTRGAWVGAGVVIMLVSLTMLSWTRRVAMLGAIVLILVVGLQLPGVANLVQERTETAFSSGGAGRTDIWAVGLTIFGDTPVTGVGLANFPEAYTPEVVRRTDVGVYSANNPAFRAPHSIIVGTLAELGVVGFFVLVSFVLPLVIRHGWGPEARAVQAAIASLMVSAIFLDLLYRKHVWLMIGVGLGLAYLARRQRATEGAGEPLFEPFATYETPPGSQATVASKSG